MKKIIRAWIIVLLNKCFSKQQESSCNVDVNESKVLILMLTHLGDCVIHFPFLHSLLLNRKSALPIQLVVKQPLQEIFSNSSNLKVNGFFCPWVGASNWIKGFFYWIKLVRYLRHEKFDLVIVTHPHFLTSLTARLCGTAHTIGYVEEGDNMLSQSLSFPLHGHVDKRWKSLLKNFDIENVENQNWHPFDPYEVLNGREIVRKKLISTNSDYSLPFICLHPGAGGSAKVWPWRNFSMFLEHSNAILNLPIVLVGGPGEVQTCNQIYDDIKDRCVVTDLSGKLNVGELFGLFCEAGIYIGNDSGPTHLAASSGVPVFCIFGPASKPDIWKPAGQLVELCYVQDESFYNKSSIPIIAECFQEFVNKQNTNFLSSSY